MKVVTIIGARPQFIKTAVVSRAFRDHFPDLQEIIVHTGQHYDANMSDVFFRELDIPYPDHYLGIGGGTHGQNTGRMIESIETVLTATKPDYVLVYGDTDSTLAGAIAASKLHIPVAHIEAGLRSFNRFMPEEINRVLTDHVSQLLFTPTKTADQNLAREGIQENSVHRVGDVMYDASLYYSKCMQGNGSILDQSSLDTKNYILVTIHRAENTDYPDKLREIIRGLSGVTLTVVWPLHPRTRKCLTELQLSMPDNIKLIEPVGYLDMLMLEKHAKFIVTDSGGVQKEAYFHQVPCITVREETEWIETVEAGWNCLVGANAEKIVTALRMCYNPNKQITALYGNGQAGLAIAKVIACGFD
ncbi:non-hydrolyzing UDP-N-acetylglucosamine 2-epimerase [Cylindrospermopsis raciborskii]|uniref:non-hydrolyzing UDP-N-acetylglucosamine 2-epimerase n=1 Tax=Cylindrospermopsis raciborskii TaxID=77022 RepID=UPI0008DDC03E|nr:UDP-N-acetylglucosamine 2-epimerase (non-hydrolyzing) [Cylindrospermopsis raciborskii]NLQ06423.1 UDP-N-acetylglucosamine 2-epimerase (non-hydrolyzing) [Cylindrospermopsis raciborskii MVCC19]OHY34140.1 UDP-N-acetylglucosamine 2-epimerase [Cylindrospermopsis raciborskii MVCC14]